MTHEPYLMAEDPTIDLEIAEAMVEELEDYILGDDLYRTVIVRTSAGDKHLNMSGGELLARLGRLQGERSVLSVDEQHRLDTVQDLADRTIKSLRTRFTEKLNREFKARLDSLRYYLNECADDLAKCRTEYPFEMRNRQRIVEIERQLGDEASPALVAVLAGTDTRINQLTKGSSFIWDTRLAGVYPPDQYWFLYRRP